MEDLRAEIRAAFETEQAGHPPRASLRRNVVDAVAAHPRREPALQWVAVAAAVLIGLAVVAGLMSSRLAAHRAPVPGSTPQASPVADYGPPPAGVPLLYVHDPNNSSWLIGYDWSGQLRGTVKLSPGVAQAGVRMAPDGSAFEVGSSIKGGSNSFLDRLGNPVLANGSSNNVAGEMWADDNRHLCMVTLNQQTFAWGLSTKLPGQAEREVAVVARDKSIGQTGITVAACSFQNDRAILVRTTIAWVSEVWAVKLTSGQIVSHHAYVGGMVANIVASRDADYLAQMPGLGVDNLRGLHLTLLLRVSSWTVVGDLREGTQVLGFSGDDSLLLADQPQPDGFSLLTLLDWRSGAALWHDQGTATLGGFVAQPGGRAFALVFTTSGSVTPGIPDPLATIVIVNGDGSATKFPQRYEPTW